MRTVFDGCQPPPLPSKGEFRRSHCLRQALAPNLPPPRPSLMNLQNAPATNIPHPNQRSNKKPTYSIDYSTLTRLFRRKNFTSMKKGFSLQQCASILLPIMFSSLLIVVCVVAALALLTDGFSLCECRNSNDTYNEDNSTSLCLTNECIRKAYYLIDRLDRSIQPCDNFYQFACGHSAQKHMDETSRFQSDLRARLEQKPRPSFPLPYRLLFDFYDSCTSDEHQEQLSTQPLNTLISRIGGWSLLQNAKFDADNFEWEALESQLHSYGINGFFTFEWNFSKNQLLIQAPKFMLASYRRQHLDEFLTRLLVELDVDEELAQVAVQEALDFESSLIDDYPIESMAKLKLPDLKVKFPKIQWDKLLPLSIDNGQGGAGMDIIVQVEYVNRLEQQLAQNGTDKQPLANYVMLRLMHSLVSHLPRRYRVIRERLENHYEQRWQVCFNELIDLMPLPLYAFSMSEEAKQQGSVKRLPKLIAKGKELLAKQLRQIAWIDPKSKERMLRNLHNLRVLTNLLGGQRVDVELKALYSSERLDPTSYFDNVLMLRQINERLNYKLLATDHNWPTLILNESPEINALDNELVYGPVSLNVLRELPESVQELQIRRNILEYLFHSDALTQWKPEPRSIFQAKRHCFDKDPNNPSRLIYDQMALQAANDENEIHLNEEEVKKLPGLADYSQRQLMYMAFAASRCNQLSATTATQETEKNINQIFQNSDPFADAFKCHLGSPMNPQDKCAVL